MMKKLFWLVLSTVILTGQSIFAQEADSEVQSSQREDSLLQVVNELSDRVQKTEDAARNERIWKKRAKYFNIGYITNQTLTDKVDAEAEWKSDFGVSLTFGKTYYLHKKPLLNMISSVLTQHGLNFRMPSIPNRTSLRKVVRTHVLIMIIAVVMTTITRKDFDFIFHLSLSITSSKSGAS